MVRLPKLFPPIPPEFRAQSNGVALGCAVGWIICEFTNLPEGWFFLLTIASMFLLGLGFTAYDAMLAKSGEPAVTLRALFWRGLSEAGFGFALMLVFEALRVSR